MKKIIKLLHSPGAFFRDYFNKRYPVIYNEIKCPEFEEEILVRHDLLLENILPVNFPIDVVFTWVDDSDPEWQKKYKFYKDDISSQDAGLYACDEARFSNNDEIKYSVESVLTNLPWVRKIYIVTDQQDPRLWEKNEKVQIIDHVQIIDKVYLPTFNSHVIEANLHKIPNLAEHFIYFNDDVFVARQLPAGHFFKSNGLASLFISGKSLKIMLSRGVHTPTLKASNNCVDIIERDYSIFLDTPLVHTYVPLRKSIYELAWNNYNEIISSFLSNKFRKDNDINMATFFVPWLSYISGKSTISRDICHYFNIRSKAARSNYKHLKKSKKENTLPHSFCANDFNIENSNLDGYKNHLLNTLKFLFRK